MAISGSRFELAFYGYPWWPYFIFFPMFKTLLNYHILKYGVPIIRSCRTHVFIGCGNILSLYVKYGTVSLGLRFMVIFFWNCITQKQSHIETPYRQWRDSVVMAWRHKVIPLSAANGRRLSSRPRQMIGCCLLPAASRCVRQAVSSSSLLTNPHT